MTWGAVYNPPSLRRALLRLVVKATIKVVTIMMMLVKMVVMKKMVITRVSYEWGRDGEDDADNDDVGDGGSGKQRTL